MKKLKKSTNSKTGFTLVELMIVAAILAVVISGILQLYIHSSVLAKLAGNKTLVVSEAQSMIEKIRNHDFDSIESDYSLYTFSLNQLNGKGGVYITDVYGNAELFEIEVNVSWEDKFGRIIGEDANLNGAFDAGEDANSNTEYDPGVSITSMITRR